MNLKTIAKLGVAALTAQKFAMVHAAPTGTRPTGNSHALAARDSFDLEVSANGAVVEVPAYSKPTHTAKPKPPQATKTPVAQAAPAAPSVPSALTAPSAPAVQSAAPSAIAPASAASALAPIGAPSAGPNDPSVVVVNKSSTPRYYTIEASVGSDPQGLNNRNFSLQPGQSISVNTGDAFNGAFTDHGSSPLSGGTRLEVNFGQAGKTWYDADLERGNTAVTLGPTDTALAADDGRPSLVGNTLTPYITAGAVAGQPESDLDKQSDLGTHVISTQKMTITSF